MITGSDKSDELIAAFQQEISKQEDLLYGVALFFEALTHLHAGNKDTLESYRKQFSNIIQLGNESIRRASAMVQIAKENPDKAALFEHFTFVPCLGHAKPEELVRRAAILVQTYEEIFPGRPRGRPFLPAEILRLMEAAAVRLV